MDKLIRDNKIILLPNGDKEFTIADADENVLVDGNEDYIVYLKNVMFRRDGKIQGTYLGTINENDPLMTIVDKKVDIVNGKFKINGENIRLARMVTINNKNNIFVTI